MKKDRREVEAILRELEQRFSAFRRDQSKRTLIPDDLRQAAVEAAHAGVPERDLLKMCGVSAAQVHTWRAQLGESLTTAVRPSAEEARRALKLYVGPFVITVEVNVVSVTLRGTDQ